MNQKEILKALREIEEDRKEEAQYPTTYIRNHIINNTEEQEPRKNNTCNYGKEN